VGKRKRERDRALAMGADAAYGRYVRFACPAFSNAWIFFGPFAAFMGWATTLDLVHIFRGEGGLGHGWFAPLGVASTVLTLCGTFSDRIERRVGGPTPLASTTRNGSGRPGTASTRGPEAP